MSLTTRFMAQGLALSSLSVLFLSGCSSAFNAGLNSAAEKQTAQVSGIIHGGQYPVTGATVSIYAVGATAGTAAGYSAALPAPVATTTSGDYGAWSVAPFSCTVGDELYLVSIGGNPGLSPGTDNQAIVLTSVIGPCGSNFSTYFDINEVSTVATEYALAGFSTGYLNIGVSAANILGLQNAFATVPNLVNLATGQAWTVTPAYAVQPAHTNADTFRSIVPYDTINALANSLASCINTSGSGSTACQSLFSYTGGAQSLSSGNGVNNSPNASLSQNTADAALYVAHNPGLPGTSFEGASNVANLLNLAPALVPFGPTLASAPNDLTLTLNFKGGGLGGIAADSISGSAAVAIDDQGSLWITNVALGTLTKLNNLGAPLSSNTTTSLTAPYSMIAPGGFSGGGMTAPGQAAVDLNGNVWVTDGSNCLTKFNSSGAALSPGSGYSSVCTAGQTNNNMGIAVDASNNVWVEGNLFVSAASNSGTKLSGFPHNFTSSTILTDFLGADYAGNVWFVDSKAKKYGKFNTSGTLAYESGAVLPSQIGLSAAFAPYGGNLSIFLPGVSFIHKDGIAVSPGAAVTHYALSYFATPEGTAADGNGSIYVANQTDGSVPDDLIVMTNGGAQVSPYPNHYTGGSALTSLASPFGVAVDQAGNVWVVNGNDANPVLNTDTFGAYESNVTEFVGLAAPVNPVYAEDAKNSTYGVKP